jgi:hypothetical protein
MVNRESYWSAPTIHDSRFTIHLFSTAQKLKKRPDPAGRFTF